MTSNCEHELSFKEALEVGLRPTEGAYLCSKVSAWVRLQAQLHHWYVVWFRGHTPIRDANHMFVTDHVIVGKGPPRCDICFGPIGQCIHVPTTGEQTIAEFNQKAKW